MSNRTSVNSHFKRCSQSKELSELLHTTNVRTWTAPVDKIIELYRAAAKHLRQRNCSTCSYSQKIFLVWVRINDLRQDARIVEVVDALFAEHTQKFLKKELTSADYERLAPLQKLDVIAAACDLKERNFIQAHLGSIGELAELECPYTKIRLMSAAAFADNTDILEELIKINRNLLYQTSNFPTALLPIHFAIYGDNIEAIRLLAGHDMQLLEEPGRGGNPPICIACAYGKTATVKELLALRPALIRAKTANGIPLVNLAISNDHSELALYLIETDPGIIDEEDPEGVVPIFAAVIRKNLGLVKKILEIRPDWLTRRCSLGASLMEIIATTDDMPLFQEIYRLHPELIYQENPRGRLPLHHGLHYNARHTTKAMIEIDPSLIFREFRYDTDTCENTMTPIKLALRNGLEDVLITMIIHRPCLIDNFFVDLGSKDPLIHLASEADLRQVVLEMLVLNPKLLISKNSQGETPDDCAESNHLRADLLRYQRQTAAIFKTPGAHEEKQKKIREYFEKEREFLKVKQEIAAHKKVDYRNVLDSAAQKLIIARQKKQPVKSRALKELDIKGVAQAARTKKAAIKKVPSKKTTPRPAPAASNYPVSSSSTPKRSAAIKQPADTYQANTPLQPIDTALPKAILLQSLQTQTNTYTIHSRVSAKWRNKTIADLKRIVKKNQPAPSTVGASSQANLSDSELDDPTLQKVCDRHLLPHLEIISLVPEFKDTYTFKTPTGFAMFATLHYADGTLEDGIVTFALNENLLFHRYFRPRDPQELRSRGIDFAAYKDSSESADETETDEWIFSRTQFEFSEKGSLNVRFPGLKHWISVHPANEHTAITALFN